MQSRSEPSCHRPGAFRAASGRTGSDAPSARRSAGRDRSCRRCVAGAAKHAEQQKQMNPEPRALADREPSERTASAQNRRRPVDAVHAGAFGWPTGRTGHELAGLLLPAGKVAVAAGNRMSLHLRRPASGILAPLKWRKGGVRGVRRQERMTEEIPSDRPACRSMGWKANAWRDTRAAKPQSRALAPKRPKAQPRRVRRPIPARRSGQCPGPSGLTCRCIASFGADTVRSGHLPAVPAAQRPAAAGRRSVRPPPAAAASRSPRRRSASIPGAARADRIRHG